MIFNNIKGFSLLSSVVGMGVAGITIGALGSMIAMQHKQIAALNEKMAFNDLKIEITHAFSDDTKCEDMLVGLQGNRTGGSIELQELPVLNSGRNFEFLGRNIASTDQSFEYGSLEINSLEVELKNELNPNSYSADLRVGIKTKSGASLKKRQIPIVLNFDATTNQVASCGAIPARDMIFCSRNISHGFSGAGIYAFAYAAGDCTDGILPDSTYVPVTKYMSFCGGEQNVVSLAGGETASTSFNGPVTGPGGKAYVGAPCTWPMGYQGTMGTYFLKAATN